MHVLVQNAPWMVWNLILALVPLGLASVLFTGPERRLSPWWWVGAAAFVAFLPNAPYVMTDVIHLRGDLALVRGRDRAMSGVLLQYGVFILIGVVAYAGSHVLLRRFLVRRGLQPGVIAIVHVALHGVCAIGVLLGRFARFNSWDLMTRPSTIAEHLSERVLDTSSWRLLVITFAAIVTTTQLTVMSGRMAQEASARLLRSRDRDR
jgi:uncharacterized membrane protein